jgi:hypothetical protein
LGRFGDRQEPLSVASDNNDDGDKRLRGGRGLVLVAPKLKHAVASLESAALNEKTYCAERKSFCARKCNATFRRARFDRAAN